MDQGDDGVTRAHDVRGASAATLSATDGFVHDTDSGPPLLSDAEALLFDHLVRVIRRTNVSIGGAMSLSSTATAVPTLTAQAQQILNTALQLEQIAHTVRERVSPTTALGPMVKNPMPGGGTEVSLLADTLREAHETLKRALDLVERANQSI